MTIQIDELTASVDIIAPPAAAAATTPHADSTAQRERARQAAERAARVVRRTRSEGYDD